MLKGGMNVNIFEAVKTITKVSDEMKSLQFYCLRDIMHLSALHSSFIHFIFSDRNNGKSFAVKEYCLKEAWKERKKKEIARGKKFIIVRRYSADFEKDGVYEWLKDYVYDKTGFNHLEKMTGGEYDDFMIAGAAGKIYMIKKDNDGKVVKKYHVGMFMSMNECEKMKSRSLLDYNNIIIEEFISSKNSYLYNECDMVNSILSTFVRDRTGEDCKAFFLGNTEKGGLLNPYFEYYSVSEDVQKMKPGEIMSLTFNTKEFDRDGNEIKVGVEIEYAAGKDNNKAFYGKSLKNVSSEWNVDNQPCLTEKELEDFSCFYTIYVSYKLYKFKCEFYIGKNGELFVFVKPFKKIFFPNERVISDSVSKQIMNPFTTYGFKPLNSKEATLFQLFSDSRCFFNSNETGTNFKICYEDLSSVSFK